MENKCPKCGQKLHLLYLKPVCPQCGINLMYYNMESRLEDDAVLAEREAAKFQKDMDGIKASSIRSPLAIARLVFMILAIGALAFPLFQTAGGGTTSLVGLIQQLLAKDNGGVMQVLFGGTAAISATILCLGGAVMGLLQLIFSLFSFTRHGGARDLVIAAVLLVLEGVCGGLLFTAGARFQWGFFTAVAVEIVVLFFHVFLGKKLKADQ